MKTLDELISEAGKKGGMTALTIWPTAGGWQCNVRRRSKGGQEGWVCVTHADPVAGIRAALDGRKVHALPPPAEDDELLV